MFDIGFLEIIMVAIIGLLVLGPERLPVAARTVGRWVGKARRMASQFTKEIDRQLEIEEIRADLKKQGESLNIEEDVQKIHTTVNAALKEAEAEIKDFEPLPRKSEDKPFAASSDSLANPQTLKQTSPHASQPTPIEPSSQSKRQANPHD